MNNIQLKPLYRNFRKQGKGGAARNCNECDFLQQCRKTHLLPNPCKPILKVYISGSGAKCKQYENIQLKIPYNPIQNKEKGERPGLATHEAVYNTVEKHIRSQTIVKQ